MTTFCSHTQNVSATTQKQITYLLQTNMKEECGAHYKMLFMQSSEFRKPESTKVNGMN